MSYKTHYCKWRDLESLHFLSLRFGGSFLWAVWAHGPYSSPRRRAKRKPVSFLTVLSAGSATPFAVLWRSCLYLTWAWAKKLLSKILKSRRWRGSVCSLRACGAWESCPGTLTELPSAESSFSWISSIWLFIVLIMFSSVPFLGVVI